MLKVGGCAKCDSDVKYAGKAAVTVSQCSDDNHGHHAPYHAHANQKDRRLVVIGPPAMSSTATTPSSSSTCRPTAPATRDVPRRPRQNRDPIVCDENSQHGAAATSAHTADPVNTGAEDKDTVCYTAVGGVEEFLPDTTTCVASTATTAASSSSCTGILRLEPQSPSCPKRPPQSCLIVKSLEDSIHSVGLSHRRPSGKAIHRSSHPSTTTIGTSTCTGNSSHIDDDLSISFNTIFLREYPVCIGDNPSVSDPDGPPLQLCWEPDCELSIAIDEFEEYRNGLGQDCVARRRGEDLRIDSERRKYMALQSGHTHQEISSTVRQVNRDRRRRSSAGRNNFFDTAKESAARKLKRLVLRQKKDSELYREFTEDRRRALAEMTISEEAADTCNNKTMGDEMDQRTHNPSASAAAIVIKEESTHRGLPQ